MVEYMHFLGGVWKECWRVLVDGGRLCINVPGDVVLDPFMGSGSTAVAAVELYRRYIGYDISADYCRMAEERVAGAYTLFQQQECHDAMGQA